MQMLYRSFFSKIGFLKWVTFSFLLLAILLFLMISKKANAQPIDVIISDTSFRVGSLFFLIASDLHFTVISF